jgi:hypothetical protein
MCFGIPLSFHATDVNSVILRTHNTPQNSRGSHDGGMSTTVFRPVTRAILQVVTSVSGEHIASIFMVRVAHSFSSFYDVHFHTIS